MKITGFALVPNEVCSEFRVGIGRNGVEIGNQKPSAAVVSINFNLLSFPVSRACFPTCVGSLGVDVLSCGSTKQQPIEEWNRLHVGFKLHFATALECPVNYEFDKKKIHNSISARNAPTYQFSR